MGNEALLSAISEMLDKKINPLENRMDSMEKRMVNMEKDLKQEIRIVKEEVGLVKEEVGLVKEEVGLVKKEVDLVKEEVHIINLKLENIIEPRLNTIENCYLDTFHRYQYGVDKIEKLEMDNSIVRSLIQKHDDILKRNQIA